MQNLQRASWEELSSLKERLWREGNTLRVSYVVGAVMARRIEQVDGRLKLLKTIESGPQAFLETYLATSPPAEFGLWPVNGHGPPVTEMKAHSGSAISRPVL
jgi:hypothetical protein